MSTQVSISLVIRGSALDHEQITRLLGVAPTRAWTAGELVPGTTQARRNSGWKLIFGPMAHISFEEELATLATFLSPRIDALRQLTKDSSVEALVSFDALVEDSQQPLLTVPPDILRLLALCGLALEVDYIGIAADAEPELPSV